jgi:hypothetical protein
MDSTNEIENAAVALRWGFLNARLGRPWRGLDATEGLPRFALLGGDACERRVDLHPDRSCTPTCGARRW